MHTAKALAIPSLVYVTVTVLAPALNGAYVADGFRTHAMWVLICCSSIVGLLALAERLLTGKANPTRSSRPMPGRG